ncbi:MAG: phosphate signaling complex protein PhoU [Acidimicrobiia bacterium]|nr:phosphate signaling complex protein PhoU [Acidimicrobiia bacterium]
MAAEPTHVPIEARKEPVSVEEARHHFTDTLAEIRHGIADMGALIVENARRAGLAITENRTDLVPVVIAGDEPINSCYARLEKLTFETMARQQPVAGDLRFLVSATRILYELERSGDLVVNLVNAYDRIHVFPDSPALRNLLEQLVEESTALFAKAMDVFDAMDAVAGEKLDEEDDVVDEIVSEFYQQIGRESDQIGLEAGIALTRMGRFLERIADHAVNVGEHTTYIVTSEFPHAENASQIDGPE